MSVGYTKLFSSIITSTIWTEDDKTRILWITMLALADKNGEVQASIPGLARVAGMSVQDCETAIHKFLSPDPYSRTPDDEGRRIEVIPGGWGLLNHGKYREMASRDELKEAEAERKRRYRDRQKRNQSDEMEMGHVPKCPKMSHDVPKTLHIAEAEAEADTEINNKSPLFALDLPKSSPKPAIDKTPLMIRIGKIMGRRESTKWIKSEIDAFNAIDWHEDDISLIEDFYKASERDKEPLHRRTGLLALLNHWADEVSKATAWERRYGRPRKQSATTPKPTIQKFKPMTPEQIAEVFGK